MASSSPAGAVANTTTPATPAPLVSTQASPASSSASSAPLPSLSLSPAGEDAVQRLASLIAVGRPVTFLSGAGLSAASGIRPYRMSNTAIWQEYVLEWGTRKKFLSNPSEWWNEFWLKTHQTGEFDNALPNDGHHAITQLMTAFPEIRIITQNIDRLHTKAGAIAERLAEIHGQLHSYKCTNASCSYSRTKYWTSDQITLKWEKKSSAVPVPSSTSSTTSTSTAASESKTVANTTSSSSSSPATSGDTASLSSSSSLPSLVSDDAKMLVAPRCLVCGAWLMPMALFFDEDYDSHKFYRASTAAKWMKHSAAIVFVGTSFSVGITSQAMMIGYQSRGATQLYNINLYAPAADDEEARIMIPTANHILGPAHQTLPYIAAAVRTIVNDKKKSAI